MSNSNLRYFRFKALLQNDQWLSPAYVGVDSEGIIKYLSNQPNADGFAVEAVSGYALPGFQNSHSHAFQYAMAGLAERHTSLGDDFWSWREEMYKCALLVSPEQAEAIAAMLYSEMVRHGYTSVAEFHYLHHDKDGLPYSNLAEMGERMISAAKTAGIKITLVPVFYKNGGFGSAPQSRQRRFISKTVEEYFKLLDASEKVIRSYKYSRLGISAHSLRAVGIDDIKVIIDQSSKQLPFHIHVAEQKKEIDDCVAFYGKRPMQLLHENASLNERFHLVHSTHLDDNELKILAASHANVVLCPSTEGNLGDGIFRMKEYYQLKGKWSIGTDSHIGLNPFEEFRMIDYRQRLVTNKRNTFSDGGAKYMLTESLINGKKAMGIFQRKFFEVGQAFDAVIIDANAPLLHSTHEKNILDTIVYTGDSTLNLGTVINGVWIVKNQNHLHSESIRVNFNTAIRNIANR